MAHALLAPSSASRWLVCTPSARLESSFPDTAGVDAATGTLAHRLGELLIKRKIGRIHNKPYESELKDIMSNPLFDTSMMDYCEEYAVFIIEKFHEAQSLTPDAELLLETKVDLTAYIEEGFGTVDIRIIANGKLQVIDLKYGKGVPVSAVENRQCMVYALGALRECDFLYDIHTVEMVIYQPRLDSVSSWELPVGDLHAWAQEELIPRAKLAYDGEGPYVAGTHCRFCRAKTTCRANAEFNQQLASFDFRNPDLLTPKEIAAILSKADQFKNWIGAVEEYALAAAIRGDKFPGWKLVEGRSSRIYTSEEAIAEKLLKEGYDETAIYKKKLLGITDMEKELGKADFNRYLSDLIVKPKGKPVLVTVSDKRPELNSTESAIADFQ